MTPQEKFLQQSLSKDIEILRDQLLDKNRILDEKMEQIQKDIYTVKVIVAGNGDPTKSLVVRFDRMEQAHHRNAWLLKTALGASISAIVGLASVIIKHFFFH